MYISAFGVYNSKQVNVSGIQISRAQFLALHLRQVMLNAANIYLFRIIHTKRKYIYRYFADKSRENILAFQHILDSLQGSWVSAANSKWNHPYK